MPKMNIPSRDGIAVFVNEGGTISIQQDRPLGDESDIVVVHPSDVQQLIEFLEAAKAEAEASD
jgi:uncharacterized protein YlxW (UPF0749 family)